MRRRGGELVSDFRLRVQCALSHAGVFEAFATPTCVGSGARTPSTRPRLPYLRANFDIGYAKPYRSIGDMVADPAIDALWLTGPNHARVENVEEIVARAASGQGTLRGIACEKPLARTVAEAAHIARLVKRTGITHGYLENQVFAPQVQAGHTLCGRAAPQRLAGRIWRARPKSTAARTCPGSGAASCRAAAC